MGSTSANELAQGMLASLIKIAAGQEHDRLEALLKLVANVAGFKTDVKFTDKTRPDVLRTLDGDASALLIADAKVAPHDVPTKQETADQIRGYIASFKNEISYTSAVIAIATNTEEAANEWVTALTAWIKEAGLGPGNLSWSMHDNKTWIVIGGIDRPLE